MGANMSKTFNDLRQKLAKDRSVSEYSVTLPYLRRKATFTSMKNKELKSFLKAMEKKDEFLINEALDQILENCVQHVEGMDVFDPDQLCMQDRTYLLLRIRRESRGPEATFPHLIEGKDEPISAEVNIDELKVDYAEEPIEKTINLDSTSIKLVLGLSTRKNEKELENWIKKTNCKNNMIERRYGSYAALLRKVIEEEVVDGDDTDDTEKTVIEEEVNLSFEEKVKLISDYLTPNDLEKFDKFAEEMLDFGVRLEFHCVHGDYENEREEINLLSFFII